MACCLNRFGYPIIKTKIMKLLLSGFCLAGLLFALQACNNSQSTSHEDAVDSAKTVNKVVQPVQKDASDFAVAAANGGMMEVELGKIAEEKAMNKKVKDFGAMMVKDHSKANDELKAAAKAKDITLPAAMSDKCQKKLSELTQKQGADFDKAYADLMVSDHKDDIDEFKKEAEKGNDKDLSAWAKGKVPVLQHHLMVAEQTKKAVDKK